MSDITSALRAITEAHNARDWDRVRAHFADDFHFADHRPTGFGSGEGPDTYVRILKLAIELVPDRQINLVQPVPEAPAEVFHFVASGTDEFGSSVEWDFLAVYDVRDGLVSRLEVFTIDDYEAAVACAKSLPGR